MVVVPFQHDLSVYDALLQDGMSMNLQSQRIEALCGTLWLPGLSAEHPALAQQAAQNECGLATTWSSTSGQSSNQLYEFQTKSVTCR